MTESKPERTEKTPAPDGGPAEPTVVDGRVERTERFLYSPAESTPPPEAAALIETTDPAAAAPVTKSGTAKWQPTIEPNREITSPNIAVAPPQPAPTGPGPSPAASPRGTAPAPAIGPQSLAPSFADTVGDGAERAVLAGRELWQRLVVFLRPHLVKAWRAVQTFFASAAKRVRAAARAARDPDAVSTPLDVEAEASDVADRGRAKEWDKFREGKRSSGYLIKDDK